MADKFEDLNNFYKADDIRSPWGLAHYLERKHGQHTQAEYAAALEDEQTQGRRGKRNRPRKGDFSSRRKGSKNYGKAFVQTKRGVKKYSPRAAKGHYTKQANKAARRAKKSSDDMDKYISLLQSVGGEPLIKEDKLEKKISPGLAALAGWYISGDVTRGLGHSTPAQQREFERQIQQAMRNKGRRLRKDEALEKMQQFFDTKDNADTYVRRAPVQKGVAASETDLSKVWYKSPSHQVSIPPLAGARFDPTARRWVKPENLGQTYQARGGKKRIRGTGTGVHERSVSGHGKGRIRGEGAGRKFKGETDVAAQRRKEGFTHVKPQPKKTKSGKLKRAAKAAKKVIRRITGRR